MEWLIENKEWLFSGAGILIIGLIAKLIKNKKSKKPIEQRSGNNSIQVNNSNGNVVINNNTNNEILEEIKKKLDNSSKQFLNKNNISEDDLKNWDELFKIFYSSGLIKKLTTFCFSTSYKIGYFEYEDLNGADYLQIIEENPLPYFINAKLQEEFLNFSQAYQNAIDMLCNSHFESEKNKEMMVINSNYSPQKLQNKIAEFDSYCEIILSSFKKMFLIVKGELSINTVGP